jgi:hypothetical protein
LCYTASLKKGPTIFGQPLHAHEQGQVSRALLFTTFFKGLPTVAQFLFASGRSGSSVLSWVFRRDVGLITSQVDLQQKAEAAARRAVGLVAVWTVVLMVATSCHL